MGQPSPRHTHTAPHLQALRLALLMLLFQRSARELSRSHLQEVIDRDQAGHQLRQVTPTPEVVREGVQLRPEGRFEQARPAGAITWFKPAHVVMGGTPRRDALVGERDWRVQGTSLHSAHMTGRNWGVCLQWAIFLPIQTILHATKHAAIKA